MEKASARIQKNMEKGMMEEEQPEQLGPGQHNAVSKSTSLQRAALAVRQCAAVLLAVGRGEY